MENHLLSIDQMSKIIETLSLRIIRRHTQMIIEGKQKLKRSDYFSTQFLSTKSFSHSKL